MGDLFFFTGAECPHCHEMDPLIEKLEKELNIKLKKLEVWHNAENAKLLQKLDNGKCGGVPFFFNKNSGKALCGAVSYEKLKAWAQGK
ncbi:MAG: hypothetical protein ABIB47_04400 [Candidatus Woesearchaeota archaeon]